MTSSQTKSTSQLTLSFYQQIKIMQPLTQIAEFYAIKRTQIVEYGVPYIK